MTQEVLRTYADIGVSLPTATQRFIRDYAAMKDDLTSAENAIKRLIEAIDNTKPLFGAQTPEGNVTSNASQVYFDTTNSPASVTMYFNENEGVNTGWVIVA